MRGEKNCLEHWTPSKIKYIARYINGYPFKPKEWGDSGRPIIRIQNLTNQNATFNYFDGVIPDIYLVKKGDILLSWSASLGAYEWDGSDAWLNQHIFKVELNEKLIEKSYFRWLAFWFMSELDKEAHGSTMQHVTKDKFGSFKLCLPSKRIQQKIADFLDRETARIDALIEAKEKMLALLEEKRQALISHAVTKGIDPDVKMKDSGIEWLGEIPAHWEVERAKHIFQVRDERTETGDEELLTVSHITGVTPRSEKQVYMFEAEDKVGYKKCYPGDLVINTLWAWMGAMGVAPISGIVSPDYHVYVTNGTLLPEFIDFLCHSRPFVAEVNRWSKGVWSSRLRLYPENFFEIELPIPPSEEQKQIVNHIDTFTDKSLQLSKEIEKSIALLKERRAALISAAVAGKINKG